MPDYCSNKPKIRLVPLQPGGATHRVIRQYHQEDGELKQINRVDWEPERPTHGDPIEWNTLQLPKADQIGTIVVHDLAKGVVNENLISRLRKLYPKAAWYVRSKIIRPKWLKQIEGSLELLVIGPEVAAQLNPRDTWSAYDKITIQALDIIKQLPGKNVVLLSDRREVIGRLNGARDCMIEEIDFKSLNSEKTDTERLQDEARLEQVYLGATMIRKHFSDVQEVSKEILEWFHRQDPSKQPARKIRKYAASMRNVQYGKITRANCESWWEELPHIEDGAKPVKLVFG